MEAIPFPPPPVLESIRTLAWNMGGPKWLQSIDYKCLNMVEAGGVEPPSEKRYDAKPTCLAQFIVFARRA